MFIYCFEEQDKEELILKGYKFLREDSVIDSIGDKKVYVFIDNNKLDFELNNKKFIRSSQMNF